MTTRAYRALTLVVAAAIFAFGGITGFRLLTSSADTADPAPTCTNKTVKKGEQLDSNLVTVNVFNASTRSGLANRVTINLQTNGFLGGAIGNNESATKPEPRGDPDRRPEGSARTPGGAASSRTRSPIASPTSRSTAASS